MRAPARRGRAVAIAAAAVLMLLVAARSWRGAWSPGAAGPSPARHDLAGVPPDAPPSTADPLANAASGTAATGAGNAPRPMPPPSLSGFWDWTPEHRLDVVTAHEQNPRLPPDIVAFYAAAIRDRGLDEVTRNNLCNAVLDQDDARGNLAPTLIAMIHDPTESCQWREYAVQHLALAVRRGDREGIPVLWEQANRGDAGIPGTAMLQLHRLERDGFTRLDAHFDQLIMQRMLDEDADLLVRMTAISIAAERRDAACLPALRSLARAPQGALRRVSIVALAAIADPTDRATVDLATRDPDPLVAKAAATALTSWPVASP